MAEYCQAVSPLADALDILQSEAKCFIGYLLPTLVTLNVQKDLKYVHALTTALITGIDKRFGQYFDRRDIISS